MTFRASKSNDHCFHEIQHARNIMICGIGSVQTIAFDSRMRFFSISKCRLKFPYEEMSSHSVSFLIESLSLTVRPEALASQLHGEGECFAPPIYLLLEKDRLPQVSLFAERQRVLQVASESAICL